MLYPIGGFGFFSKGPDAFHHGDQVKFLLFAGEGKFFAAVFGSKFPKLILHLFPDLIRPRRLLGRPLSCLPCEVALASAEAHLGQGLLLILSILPWSALSGISISCWHSHMIFISIL